MSNFNKIVKTLTVEEGLALIPEKTTRACRRKRIQLGEYSVNVHSLRFATFKHKGTSCVYCGAKASFFAIEYDRVQNVHIFQLYAGNKDQKILMTCDHIIPLSKGGVNKIINTQTLCRNCNWVKSNHSDEKMRELLSEVGAQKNNSQQPKIKQVQEKLREIIPVPFLASDAESIPLPFFEEAFVSTPVNDFITVQLLTVDEVLAQVPDGEIPPSRLYSQKPVWFGPHSVKTDDSKMKNFKMNGVSCSQCGVVGQQFEILQKRINGFCHLQLFGYRDLKKIEMVARKKVKGQDGGKKTLDNHETVCYVCLKK